MNKCHYYLSHGLWQITKCYYEKESRLNNLYFWGMAVAPHHTNFTSRIITSPWQQGWATLDLLEECHGNESEWTCQIFQSDDIESVRKEIDFQFIIRNYVSDPFVNVLFNAHSTKHKQLTEDSLNQLKEFITKLKNSCPATAHCFARQITSLLLPFTKLDNGDDQFDVIILCALKETPTIDRLINLTKSPASQQVFLLLLADNHSSVLRSLEEDERAQVSSYATTQLDTLLQHGLQPTVLFHTMLFTDRHFVLLLLDILRRGMPITSNEFIPDFLWPLLLIILWDKIDPVDPSIPNLIEKSKESTQDKAMVQACFMLEWYLNFSRWSESHGADAKVELEAAKEHSVLRLIYGSADLAETDWEQVRTLLREPWDFFLLDGYRALFLLLQTMVAATTLRRESVRFADIAVHEEKLASIYHEKVHLKLDEIRAIVRCLNPLRYRLEVLENMFGMLFVTWEDIRNVSMRRHGSYSPVKSPTLNTRGFVCTPHYLRDAISLIKECTAEIEREPKTEAEIDVPCSIRPSQMENRLDRLSESVSEASWRLQLITDPEFASEAGIFSCYQERHNFHAEWLVDTWHDVGKTKRRACQEKREGSGSQSPASGGETDRGVERPSGPAFMHQMLSSDWSLVVRCLSQGDLLNAEHIIAMMSTEESRQALEGELNFTQAVNDVRRKLLSLGESPTRRPSESVSKSPSRKPAGLQALQLVAAQGVTATALTGHIESFLSASTLPIIQGSSKVSLGSMLQCMENSAAIVTLDLALTFAPNFQDFRDLINVAGKHCPELTTRLQSPLTSAGSAKPLGYIAFAQIVVSLLQEINKDYEMAPGTFLRSRHASFSLKILKEQEALWKQLRNFSGELARSRRESIGPVRDSVKSQKNIKCVQKILEAVAKAAECSAEVLDLGRNEPAGTELSKNFNYAELLNRYLSDLATLALDSVPAKPDIDEMVTFHSLLDMSAVEVLDRLVFRRGIDPALLEKKAQQLGFNLCASLLWGCCPRCPQGSAPLPSDLMETDCIVLNSPKKEDCATTINDPSSFVENILTDLTEAIKAEAAKNSGPNCFVDFTTLEAFVKCANIIAILERTRILATVVLPIFQPLDAFKFYVNLCNLMTLHGHFHPQARKVMTSNQKLIRDTALWFVGYEIGSLGFVSVAELRLALCGEELPQSFSGRLRTISVEPDPRTAFILPLLELSSPGPILRLAESTTQEVQLSNAVEAFASRSCFLIGNRLVIPPLLGWYLDSVLMLEEAEGSSDGGSSHPSARLKILLEFLIENSGSGEWLAKLKSMSQSDVTIDVQQCCSPGLTLSYCSHNHSDAADLPQIIEHQIDGQRWESRSLTEPIMKQLNQNSRVLADLVARIHEGRSETPEGRGLEVGRDVLLDERLRYLEAILAAPWTQKLAVVFDNNSVLAALNKTPSRAALWDYFDASIAGKQWLQCFDVLHALPDFSLQCDVNLRRLRDLVLLEIAASSSQKDCEVAGWIYSQQISDVRLRLRSVMENYCFWPGTIAMKQLSYILQDYSFLPAMTVKEIEIGIQRIAVFNTMTESCDDFSGKTWFEVASISSNMPKTILQVLLRTGQVSLCLNWMRLSGVLESVMPFADEEFLVWISTLLPKQLPSLLSGLPSERVLSLCANSIPLITAIPGLRSIAELALKVAKDSTVIEKYRIMLLGIQALSVLDEEDQSQLVRIVQYPLLMVEQLLLNTRLDALSTFLKRLRQLPGNELVPSKAVNDLLTRYTSRAVELDVVRVIQPIARESFLVTSPASPDFVVPSEVPDKSQWVPDNQVALCMCCRLVSFSMFNRRHHCRRCGRVVCASCSPHRIKVSGYKGVSVRVCRVCYSQNSKPEGDMSVDLVEESCTSDDIHQWRLSSDIAKNVTVREEFAFEHAPDASLCLAIFNLLPSSPAFTSLLLDESERLLQILQGRDTAGNPEVDYTVLIQIIRSLVVGAKVHYDKGGYATGVVSCDRLLSQVDLISLLVRNHCTHLIPPEPLTVRVLRDRLIEEELWDLAIEVSTKAGLPVSGVWAAWGKVLLTAGCWQNARIKFAQCLTPPSQSQRSSTLLNEICMIIESTTFTTIRPNYSAQEVLEVLSTLKCLSSGKLPTSSSGGPGSPQHTEQEWYISRYGSATALLRFYLRHEQWDAALSLLLRRQLEPDIFFEYIVLPAYRNNAQERMKTEILAVDSTLETFKRHLSHACVQLQKVKSYSTLHDIQLFMQDFVRAAMTCIQSYQARGTSFTQLTEQSDLIHTALHHLEEEGLFSGKKTRCVENSMRLESKDLNRHMNTSARQLEVAKYLAACESAGQSIPKLLQAASWQHSVVPTLFDGQHARIVLAVLCMLAGKNVEEGFGLAFRIIQDNHLNPEEIYINVGEIFGKLSQGSHIEQLANCVKTSGVDNAANISDRVVAASISAMAGADCFNHVDVLIPLISNLDLKITALIDSRQLKAAYLMSVKHNRLGHVERIMTVAGEMGQTVIKDLCRKKLGLTADAASISSSVPSRDSF